MYPLCIPNNLSPLYHNCLTIITWEMSFLVNLLYIIKALANICVSIFCSLGELSNEKCDWNLYYFFVLA